MSNLCAGCGKAPVAKDGLCLSCYTELSSQLQSFKPEYRPRLSIEITEEQQSAIRDIDLPHGWQKAIFGKLIDDIIDLYNDYGTNALACLISGQAKPRSILPTLARSEDLSKKLSE